MDSQPSDGAAPSADVVDSGSESYRYILSIVCLLILLLHLGLEWRSGHLDKLDAEALGIIVVGLSPWLAQVFSSAKIFGAEFVFLRHQVERNRQQSEANNAEIAQQQQIINALVIYSLGEFP